MGTNRTPQVLFVSLGCDKNRVDTEKMMALLAERGYGFTDDADEADAAVVNSCCFIGDAKEESISNIIELGSRKKTGRLKALIVTGCLSERYRSEVLADMPEVDAVLGISGWQEIADTLDSVFAGTKEKREEFLPNNRFYTDQTKRILTTGGSYSYLKIAEGCSKRCTYCVIPSVRGPYRSVPMEQLEKEARELADKGVRELILVAQETTLYGTDLYGRKMLPELIRRLARIPGIAWIRVLYCYPEEITDELINVIRDEPKVCHYLDVPIQHASDRILKKMGRKTDEASIRRIVGKLREEIPDIVIRTTLMTGFPGETEEDFETLYRFVDEMAFERLGVFAYSREEGTPAAEMPDQVPADVANERRDRIMALQQEISASVEEACVGNLFTVMIEGRLPDEHVCVGRTYMDAPDVDGMIFVRTDADLMSGTFVKVSVTGSDQYDLTGEIFDEESESAE